MNSTHRAAAVTCSSSSCLPRANRISELVRLEGGGSSGSSELDKRACRPFLEDFALKSLFPRRWGKPARQGTDVSHSILSVVSFLFFRFFAQVLACKASTVVHQLYYFYWLPLRATCDLMCTRGNGEEGEGG